MVFQDLLFIPLVIYVGHLIINRVVKGYDLESQRRLLIRLFYYHLLFSLIYAWYVTYFGGDAVGYWKHPGRFMREGETWLQLHQTGTPFVYFLTYPFSQVLGVSFWAGSVLFSLFGFCGFVFIYLSIIKFSKFNPMIFGYRLLPLILFLPNIHFWSGGIGKDSVIFFGLTLFIFSLTNPLRNVLGIVISFYLAYFIRPHIALLMLVGFAFSLLISTKGVSFFWRVIFLGTSIYVFFLISPAVFEFIGLEENLETLEDISDVRSRNLSRANVGSGINIREYTTSMKILTFFFRPLFLDANNIFGFIVSIENLFYVIVALAILRFRNLIEILRMPLHLKTALFVLGSTAFFMSNSLSNLGIIIRQKNMVMFMFLMIAVYLISKTEAEKAGKLPKPYQRFHPHDAKAKVA